MNHAHIFDWLLEHVHGAWRGKRIKTRTRLACVYIRERNVQSDYSSPLHRIDERPAEQLSFGALPSGLMIIAFRLNWMVLKTPFNNYLVIIIIITIKIIFRMSESIQNYIVTDISRFVFLTFCVFFFLFKLFNFTYFDSHILVLKLLQKINDCNNYPKLVNKFKWEIQCRNLYFALVFH